jgi:hypothetical protein
MDGPPEEGPAPKPGTPTSPDGLQQAQARLREALERLGPEWDERRLEELPLEQDLLDQAASDLPSRYDTKKGLRPTGGWSAFLLPFLGVALIIVAVLLMGMNQLDPTTGSLLAAGGFLLIVLAALGRGKRIQKATDRRRAQEILLLYGLDDDATREDLFDQYQRLEEAQAALHAVRRQTASRR